MTAESITLINSLLTFVNSQTYEESFTATRGYQVYTELETSDVLTVSFFPSSVSYDQATKTELYKNLRIFVLVRELINASTGSSRDARIDELLSFGEELYESILSAPPSEVALSVDVPPDEIPSFDAEHMELRNQFTQLYPLAYSTTQ